MATSDDSARKPARAALSRGQLWGLLLLIAAACVLPFLVSNYRVFQFTLALVYAIALLGLNMLTGYNGQISLGHGAFYAIGAYTAAILMDGFGAPYWLTIPLAGAVCLVAGFLFGLPALRLEGLYLALATFALGVAMPQLLKYKGLEHWTGGVQGITIVKPDPPDWIGLSQDRWLYFVVLVHLVVLFAIGGRRRAWARGPMGGPGLWGGNGPWGPDGDPRRAWMADAHRRLHEEEASAAGTGGTSATTGSVSATEGPTSV